MLGQKEIIFLMLVTRSRNTCSVSHSASLRVPAWPCQCVAVVPRRACKMCDALERTVIAALSRPRGRDLSHGRAAWVVNWNLPSATDIATARSSAVEHAAHGCALPASASFSLFPNLRLYLAPCTTQCLRLPARARRRCACRACASKPSWNEFLDMCNTSSPLVPWLEPAWCQAASKLSGGVCIDSSTETPDVNPLAALDELDQDVDGAPIALCRTAFNESCCPFANGSMLDAHHHQRCGGVGRGRCVTGVTWANRQPLCRSGRCAWPGWAAAARCLCEDNFSGSSCSGCAAGWMGVGCKARRPKEVRRPITSLTPSEKADFFSVVRAALATPEAAAMEAAHEFGISFTHHTSTLILTHAAYFVKLMELVRRHSGRHVST